MCVNMSVMRCDIDLGGCGIDTDVTHVTGDNSMPP